MNLATLLGDWTDIDVAAHALAKVLGIMPRRSNMNDAKWVYWSNNRLGSELVVLLNRLTEVGFLEKREEPDLKFRANSDFRSNLKIEDVWRAVQSQLEPRMGLLVLRCSDLNRSHQFYHALGLTLTPEQHGSGARHYSVQLGATVLELYPGAPPTTTIRLGLTVSDVTSVVAAIRGIGATVVRVEDASPPSAVVRDPDGNTVELTGA